MLPLFFIFLIISLISFIFLLYFHYCFFYEPPVDYDELFRRVHASDEDEDDNAEHKIENGKIYRRYQKGVSYQRLNPSTEVEPQRKNQGANPPAAAEPAAK